MKHAILLTLIVALLGVTSCAPGELDRLVFGDDFQFPPKPPRAYDRYGQISEGCQTAGGLATLRSNDNLSAYLYAYNACMAGQGL